MRSECKSLRETTLSSVPYRSRKRPIGVSLRWRPLERAKFYALEGAPRQSANAEGFQGANPVGLNQDPGANLPRRR